MPEDKAVQVYSEDDLLIERWQWTSPPLRNLDANVVALLGPARGRALDVGCGTGRLAATLSELGLVVDGIDTEGRIVAIGNRIMGERRLPVRLYAGDILDPESPVAAGDYDVVVCTEVLEHVANWRALLDRAGELLRPGGLLLLTVPRDPGQYSVLDEYAGHVRRFRDDELIAALRAGFNDIVVRRPGWPTMRTIAWLYVRMLTLSSRNYRSQTRGLWREPGLPQLLANRIVSILLRFDNLFTRLPVGTHLVIRARRRGDEPIDRTPSMTAGDTGSLRSG